MERGAFITFEGGEGAGKSTQAALLVKALKDSGIEAVSTREPGGTPNAELIRSVLVSREVEEWGVAAEALLVNAARSEHVERFVKPRIASGTWVVCDRYFDSTIAYQGFGKGADLQQLRLLHQLATGGFLPDLTFILDVPVDEGLVRAFSRPGLTNRFDDRDASFHERVRSGFRQIADADDKRCIWIDATGTMEETADLIWQFVEEVFQLQP